MYFVSPSKREQFFLQLLLTIFKDEKRLEASKNLEWPSVCYIQEGMYNKGITGG